MLVTDGARDAGPAGLVLCLPGRVAVAVPRRRRGRRAARRRPASSRSTSATPGTTSRAGATSCEAGPWWPGTPRRSGSRRAGFRLVGAHTDSPNLRVKPRPDTGALGWRQLGVDVYGGALVNSWLDRDLGLSGRVSLARRLGPPGEGRPAAPAGGAARHPPRPRRQRQGRRARPPGPPGPGLGPRRRGQEGDFAEFLAARAGRRPPATSSPGT